jgi:hypothetical protein
LVTVIHFQEPPLSFFKKTFEKNYEEGRGKSPLFYLSILVLFCEFDLPILFLAMVEPKANTLAGFLGRKRSGRDQLQGRQ